MLQHFGNRSLQSSLDAFFIALGTHTHAMRAVTKSAFCQPRRKIKASALQALNGFWVERLHQQQSFARWHGLRVVAADGTCLRLPHRQENVAAFGAGPCGDASVLMARCGGLLSVSSGQLLDVQVGSYSQGERRCCCRVWMHCELMTSWCSIAAIRPGGCSRSCRRAASTTACARSPAGWPR